MKTEKTMKTIKITLVAVAVAVAIAAVTLMSIFLPKQSAASADTGKDAKASKTEQTIDAIEKLEAEYEKAFDANVELWEKYFAELEKLDELSDDFDEKAFVNGLTTLTAEEKATLLKSIDTLDELDAKLEKLYDELFETDEDIMYDDCADGTCDCAERDDEFFADGGCEGDILFIEDDENYFGDNFFAACEEAEKANDEVQSLKKEFDEVMDAHADVWDKVYASYDELDENFDYANFDEAKYIAELDVLTAEEKDMLLKDLAKLDEISAKLISICGSNCGR